MYSIDIMVQEHDHILRLLDVAETACCRILEGAEMHDADFRTILDFARNYADKHHHGKEEQILFRDMREHLGRIGVNLIQHGMLVEHDMGRLHLTELESALDRYKTTEAAVDKLRILTETMGYVHLLRRHIEKENALVYPYGAAHLPQDTLEQADLETRAFEDAAQSNGIQGIYLNMLGELEERYK